MNDQLTALDLSEMLRRACAGYGRPFGAKAEAMVEVWFKGCKEFPASAVREAFDAWILAEVRFPTVAGIRARCRALAPKTDGERQRSPDLPWACPVCHTEAQARTWFVRRRSRLDERPVAVIVTEGGEDVEYLRASRDLCLCGWRRQQHYLDADQKALLANPPDDEGMLDGDRN